MSTLILSLFILIGSGILALAFHARPRLVSLFGAGGCILSCGLGLIPVLHLLRTGDSISIQIPWAVPFGSFSLGVDPLTAFFLLTIFLLSGIAALYGIEYLAPYAKKKNIGIPWFFYNILIASMVMVVLARNAILFLMAWEIMSIVSYFLVTFEDEEEEVRQAGWIYLISTHIGTVFLFVMYILMGRQTGSMDFESFSQSSVALTPTAGLLFCFALIGFGTKAGLMPFHIWLPEAHPAAPSHVSAVMSGVMIKTGIYGILRILTFLGPPSLWWGWLLIGMGLFSGIIGILFALAQHDLKRLLAYSSVENIGIITIGMGLGIVGTCTNTPTVAVLGYMGALLHILNHSLFKGMLFLGAGSVLHGTGTRNINRLGGLAKQMPWTSTCFLIASIAIAGLPPLNGFVGELTLYFSAFQGSQIPLAGSAVACFAVIGGLALIGGFAAAAFSKAFGFVFLGEPHSESAIHAHEAGLSMRIPMIILAFGCLALGIFLPFLISFLTPVLGILTGLSQEQIQTSQFLYLETVKTLVAIALALFIFIGAILILRVGLFARRTIHTTGTWDCGYAQPTPRMQYTGSSYVQPFTFLFSLILHTKEYFLPPQALFPQKSTFRSETPDGFRMKIYQPLFQGIGWGISKFRWLQHGRIQLYVLYIALTLFLLLVWKLG